MRKISIVIIILFLIFIALFFFKEEGYVAIDNNRYCFKLPYTLKFAALIERESYYKSWIDKIIAPGVKDDKERIRNIFGWIKNFPDISELDHKLSIRIKNINQHEYYVLIKQYGALYERVENFCNLVAIAGYQASKIYSGGTGKVVVRIPNTQEMLYFDLELGKENIEKEISWLDRKRCKEKLENVDTLIKKLIRKKYLWADLNICKYAVFYYVEQIIFHIFRMKIKREEFLI